MIEKARIEAVKQGVDLVQLIESRGVKLKKNGKGYVGLGEPMGSGLTF